MIPLKYIPQSIQVQFNSMVTRLNKDHPELREKVIVTTDRQGLVDKVNELLADPNNIVMAAVTNEEDMARLPHISGERLRALLFKGEPGGLNDFKQVECMLAALRALYNNDAKALIALYELTSGEKFTGNPGELLAAMNDPSALARKITFILKPIPIERQEMLDRLNSRELELIRDSA